MRNFPWLTWRNTNCEKNSSPVVLDDCAQAQELLTTAFDGEANHEALAQAQRHISNCLHCAHQWSYWETNRVLLRSMPIPAVPSSLLTRILLACRLLPAQDCAADLESSNHARLAQYFNGHDDETAAASLGAILTPVPVPPDLHRRILQATTEATPAYHISVITLLQKLVPWAPASRNSLRWGMALAAPALLCWFVLADNPTSLVEIKPERVSTNTNPVKTRTQPVTAGVATTIKPLLKKGVGIAQKLPYLAAATPQPKDLVSEPEPAVKRVTHVEPHASQRLPKEGVSFAVASAPATVVRSVKAGPVQKRPAPAIDLVENHTSSVVLASSHQPIARLPLRSAPKISHPSLVAAPRLARLSENDFDEAFIAVTTARDSRPTEFSQAFDEYRAALLTEHSDLNDDVEEL